MIILREPRFEPRRRAELRAELVSRAKAWMPDWRPRDASSDFAGALLEIAARLESEVAQRIDKLPEKMFRGFLTWLGVRGAAAQAARLPVIFHMTAKSEAVLAKAPIQMQATPPPTDTGVSIEPVTFETEDDLTIVPGSLASLYAADPAGDAFYKAPDGVLSLTPMPSGPSLWTVTTDAPAGSTRIQLSPPLGLDARPMLVTTANALYRVTDAQAGLVTIDPPLDAALKATDTLTLQSSFATFGDPRRNVQQHALYIGSESLLNLPTAAVIRIDGVPAGITWTYWGTLGTGPALGWQPMTVDNTAPLVTLNKPAGSVEIVTVGTTSSRWLRGTVATNVSGSVDAHHITLTVNPDGCGKAPACNQDSSTASQVVVEGIANTTPLVLNSPFYPLGREPRLFDAFYLGSAEAFSKPNAAVNICLKAQDGTALSYTAAAASTSVATVLLFGVGADGFLHRMVMSNSASAPVDRSPAAVQPPLNQAGTAEVNASPAPLIRSQGRLSTFPRAADTLVATVAENGIWIWSENADVKQPGKWYFLGNPATNVPVPATSSPAVLLLPDGAKIHLIALIQNILYEASLQAGWETAGAALWTRVPKSATSTWTTVAPIFDSATITTTSYANGWIGVTDKGDGTLFISGANPKKILTKLLPSIRPLAIRTAPASTSILVVAPTDTKRLDAWTVFNDATPSTALSHVQSGILGNSFDWAPGSANGVVVVFSAPGVDGTAHLAAWYPQAPEAVSDATVYQSTTLAGLAGSPAAAGKHVVAPGGDAAVLALPFDANSFTETDIPDTQLATALVVDATADHPRLNDIVVMKFKGSTKPSVHVVKADAVPNGNRFWIPVPGSEKSKVVESAAVYRAEPGTFQGAVESATPEKITVAAADPKTHHTGDNIAVMHSNRISLHTVTTVDTVGTDTVLTVDPPVFKTLKKNVKVDYENVEAVPLGAPALLPLIDQTFTAGASAALLAGGAYFQDAQPAPNPVLLFDLSAPGGPIAHAVLTYPWDLMHLPTVAPGTSNFELVTNSIFGQLLVLSDNKVTNPSLSWEYFDGQAWWKIPGLLDGTSSLRSTGMVSFYVPRGLQSTEVSGKNSFWIRARLVGGDYGQETVTVKQTIDTSTTPPTTTQTVVRSLANLSPPLLGSVSLSYSVCCPSEPDFIVTSDGGATRDQTANNATDSATVMLFQPLSESIAKASSSTTADAGAGQPAIYLGFDTQFAGTPINVLFLVQNHDFSDAYPLQVDVLRQSGFEAIVCEDATRALGETGILSFPLTEEPPLVTLFGESRCWVRLRPRSTTAPWTPVISNAYLNAAYARASETQELEHLGSSDGSPGQKVTLARPPILQGTLELRVREPLGEEEIAALVEADPDNILEELSNGVEGPWVRWEEVSILAEAGKDGRAYELDSDTGTITFGDGIHGMIPPTGADSIVAIEYKRGGGADSNRVTAGSEINLISPVQGVDLVVAPVDAAGGSDPQTADEVVRFAPADNFIRDRALTLRDFEVLAVQSSRDIVQARALGSGTSVQLIAAVRGADPRPSPSQWRALVSYLAGRTTPGLAITPLAPRLVALQVKLQLAVASLEASGAVAAETKMRIQALLDPGTGGLDGGGWPFGLLPAETDLAAALDDVPNLESIEQLSITAEYNGVVVVTPRSEDLPVSSYEDIAIDFVTVEIEAGL